MVRKQQGFFLQINYKQKSQLSPLKQSECYGGISRQSHHPHRDTKAQAMNNENQGNVDRQVEKIFQDFAKGLKLGDRRAALKVRDYVRREAPVVTTNLKNSVEIPQIQSKGGSGIVSRTVILPITASYASFVIEGTEPHEIVPKRAKALAFQAGGQTLLRKKVNHPGTQSNDFPTRGIEKLQKSGQIESIYKQALNEVM
jgi:hypothetical protein